MENLTELRIEWAARILSPLGRADTAADAYSTFCHSATASELSVKLRSIPIPDEVKDMLCAAKRVEVRKRWAATAQSPENGESKMPSQYWRLPTSWQRVLCAYIQNGCHPKLLDEIIEIYASGLGLTAESFLQEPDVQEVLGLLPSLPSEKESQ